MEGTIYDKLRILNEAVKKEFKELNLRDLFKITAKLSTWHYPKKRSKRMKLTKEEAMLYEFYLNNSYNPSTVYKWMLAGNTTEEIQKKLMTGEITQKDAMRMAKPFKMLSQVEQELMYHIKSCIQKYIVR